MYRISYSTFSRWARPLLGYLAIVLAMTLFGSTLVRPTSVAKAQDAVKNEPQQAAPEAPAATFAGTGVGAIPDNSGTGCGLTPTGSLVISFAVTGLAGNVSAVSLNFNGTHSWINDLTVTLKAPGAGPSHLFFSRTGSTSATDCGNSNDLVPANTLNFVDTAASTWSVRAATNPVPAGDARTQTAGGVPAAPTATSLNTTFAGLTPAQANGTWTLTFQDQGGGDTGSISAANLTITAAAPTACTTAKRPLDFDGDGKTDPTVNRNTGGGPSGQRTWYYRPSGGAPAVGVEWGINTDFYVPGDYDGDGKSDIAVWRPSDPGNSYWYILRSSTNTLQSVNFGQTGDEPRVVGDYDGDGKLDPAVYRAGAASGDKSYWYWLSSVDGLQHGYQFGQNGDFVAPGDYDGDNKFDFVVQRNGGGGGAIFFMHRTTAGDTAVWFGTPTDVIVPGYYDLDCLTDLAVIRGSGGLINWYVLNSTNGSTSAYIFGDSATDYPTQGDWDGDGQTDISVWRPNADPTQNFFYWRRSIDGVTGSAEWGSNGDYPVANFNSH